MDETKKGAAADAPQAAHEAEAPTMPGPDEAAAPAIDLGDTLDTDSPFNIGDLAERMETLAKENSEWKDRAMRLAADMENLRRRTERELKDARAYAVTKFASDVLAIGDNLQRALDAVPEDARADEEGAISGLVEGVEMTRREFENVLERHGVAKLAPEGERFDPNLHQAMFEVPDASVPSGTVMQVVQVGYTIGERSLRPALVGVSKGGPKMPKPAAEAAPAPESTVETQASPDDAAEPDSHEAPTPEPGMKVDRTA